MEGRRLIVFRTVVFGNGSAVPIPDGGMDDQAFVLIPHIGGIIDGTAGRYG